MLVCKTTQDSERRKKRWKYWWKLLFFMLFGFLQWIIYITWGLITFYLTLGQYKAINFTYSTLGVDLKLQLFFLIILLFSNRCYWKGDGWIENWKHCLEERMASFFSYLLPQIGDCWQSILVPHGEYITSWVYITS